VRDSLSLGEKIDALVDDLPPGSVTLAEIRDLVGAEGLLVLSAFLTLVFLVPVSIPGVSTVFGAAILLVGTSRLLGLRLWLPRSIANRDLPSENLKAALRKGSRWVHRLERVGRPHRMARLVSVPGARVLNDAGLVLGAALLMLPFGLIPFSNTLPALALLFLCIGLLQSDGLFILYGHLMNVATILYFAVLLLGGGYVVLRLF
jgi:hypothetical protein